MSIACDDCTTLTCFGVTFLTDILAMYCGKYCPLLLEKRSQCLSAINRRRKGMDLILNVE